MRKLLGLTVVLAVLGVCAPSYGYILVYKVTGAMKAVDWNSEKIVSVSVKGCLAMDINDSEEVNDAQMVLDGKNANGALVYYKDLLSDPNGNGGARWDTTGGVVGLAVWDYNSPFDYEFLMTGNVKATDVGLGASIKKSAASSLKGTLDSYWAQLLDDNQDLFGSGTATMTLDTKQTKAANAGAKTVDDIITTFIAGLKGYSEITL
ncbi:MAG: hypothetical protein ABSB25_11010 [Sedimentisphaerales bacterium]|jgi:hypothetical protein